MSHIEKAKRDLQQLERSLAVWRGKNKGKRIPSDLWDEAVRLSHVVGIGKVARITRLFYPSLRARSTGVGATSGAARRTKKVPDLSFVEVPLTPLSMTEPSGPKEFRLLFELKTRLGTWKVEWV